LHIAIQIGEMKNLLPYRIISYLLLLVAALLSIACIPLLIIGLFNIPLLLPVLICVCIVVYILSSFIFLVKTIDSRKEPKQKLLRIIKSTSLVVLISSITSVIQYLYILYNPSLVEAIISQMLEFQKSMRANAKNLDADLIRSTAKISIYIAIFFSTTLIIHVYETYKLIKQYLNAVNNNNQNTPLQ
jgi:hypothetical protein